MKLSQLHEATVSTKNVNVALPKIISYLGRKMGVSLIRIPGIEHFHNSAGNGYGIRYVVSGSTRCIRLNWNTSGAEGQSSSISSIDIFTGTTRNPNYTIHVKGISFVQALPMIATLARSPSIGNYMMFPVSTALALSESILEANASKTRGGQWNSGKRPVFRDAITEDFSSVLKRRRFLLTEVKADAFDGESSLSDFLGKLQKGNSYTRSDFIRFYHINNVGIFDTIMNHFSKKFIINGKRVALASNTNLAALKDSIIAKAGVVSVVKGGGKEVMMKTPQEEKLEASAEKIPFADTLEHLEGLVHALIKGSYNALLVCGRGGVGKTETVERALHDNGLSDGHGYFKNTGSASAAGVFTLLYHHRNDIILFDDSDGALADQDARNLIKAATDTKKIRKMVWNKKSSFIFNPDDEDPAQYEDDLSMAPQHFDFKGRIIFISNLTPDKLDPDGALKSRAFIVNVNPSDSEVFDHMGKILHDIKLEDGLSLSKEEKQHVLEVVKSSTRKGEVSLRKLVRGLNLCASGCKNWSELVRLYA